MEKNALDKKHNDRKCKEYIQELLNANNMLIETLEDGTKRIRAKVAEKINLTFSTAKMYDIPSDDTIIWRYMSYGKFVNLIKTSALYMCNPDKFPQDSSEGIPYSDISKFINKKLEQVYEQVKSEPKIKALSGIPITHNKYCDLRAMKARWRNVYRYCRQRFYISCWTENKYESDSHWGRYTDMKDAVAIKSTVGNLKKSLKSVGLYTISRVNYVAPEEICKKSDEEYFAIVTGIWAMVGYMLTQKRCYFSADKEIRLMTDNIMTHRTQWEKSSCVAILGNEDFNYDMQLEYEAMRTPVDLKTLLDEVVIAPNAPTNLLDKAKIFLERKGLGEIKVSESKLNKFEEYIHG